MTMVATGIAGLTVRFLRRRYRQVKPYANWIGGLVLLIAFSPLIAVAAALVKLTSRGPAFYLQERVGLRGQVFKLIKLRSMYTDAESQTGPVWSSGKRDPRVTPLGRVLRKAHIDEMPQLINVLRGEMNLVGPRPERPYFVQKLSRDVPYYQARLSVKPGITGLAQVLAGPDHTIRDVRRKLKLDLRYIAEMCWWVDFRIMFSTIGKLFR